MGQLYDRNSRRAFAPVAAFQAEALPADRFISEMERGLGLGMSVGGGSGGPQQQGTQRGDSGGGEGGAVAPLGGSGFRPPGAAPPGIPSAAVNSTMRAWGLLTYAPCLVPFRERAK